jgi:murein DD-endopeptidase MepM/ murein hydrolase activator NlpD
MLKRLFHPPLIALALLMLSVALAVYVLFGAGQTDRQRRSSQVTVVATANIVAEGQPVRPFAALDPAIQAALLQDTPLNRGAWQFSPANIPSIGRYLPSLDPELGIQYELIPPPPSLNPLDNQLVDDFLDIPVISDAVGLVEIQEYGGDDCAPAGLPTSGVLTQRFHAYHSGIDIGVPLGTPTLATHSGTVAFAGWNAYGFGYLVILQNGIFITYYAHLTNFNVKAGDQVGIGSIIGWSGSTGNSTGPHVHYETRINDGPVDPLTFDARGYSNC